MHGLGDNIYSRPFIQAAAIQNERKLIIETPWPELYNDLGVYTVPAKTSLRTQGKNVARGNYLLPPKGLRIVKSARLGYDMKRPIMESLQMSIRGNGEFKMNLPSFPCPVETEKPIIVTRPVTVRKEWEAPARNPLPEYIAACVDELRDHYYIVSIADLDPPNEVAIEPLPYADLTLHHGELSVEQMLGLVSSASGVIAGVGWIVPAVMAYKVPAFIILGGVGAYNSPEVITDPRVPHSITWAVPEKFCLCKDLMHNCDKEIIDLEQQFREWRFEQCI